MLVLRIRIRTFVFNENFDEKLNIGSCRPVFNFTGTGTGISTYFLLQFPLTLYRYGTGIMTNYFKTSMVTGWLYDAETFKIKFKKAIVSPLASRWYLCEVPDIRILPSTPAYLKHKKPF